jgi:hypothetical protein
MFRELFGYCGQIGIKKSGPHDKRTLFETAETSSQNSLFTVGPAMSGATWVI